MSLSDTKKKGDKKMKLPAHVQEYIDSIESVDYFSSSGALPEGCKLYETRDDARAAAYAAARNAAWNAAEDAAWGAAAYAAKAAVRAAAGEAALAAIWNPAGVEAWGAVKAAAYAAAGDAAYGAAGDPLWDAAGDARGDASLLAACMVVQGLIDAKHLAYALQRWAIWAAGYGVAVEVGGVHYCYKRPL